MKILGITGGSNVGKTFIASFFKEPIYLEKLGLKATDIAIFDADKILAELYSHNQNVIDKIYNLYPEAIINNQVNTKKLAPFYFASDDNAKKINEASLTEIKQYADNFIIEHEKKLLGLFDVPMLIETDLYKKCDYCLVVTADYPIRRERAINRMYIQKGYDKATSGALFDNIVKKQSGLNKTEREKISPQEACQIGEQKKVDALTKENIPFMMLDNSGKKSVDEFIFEIKSKILIPMLHNNF